MLGRASGLFSAFIVLGWIISSGAAAGPSFDCNKARFIDEFAICADPKLADLDALVAAAYSSKLAALDAFSQSFERAQQRDWLRGRSSCSARANLNDVEACTSAAFLSRLAELPGDGIDDARNAIVSRDTPSDGYFKFKICNNAPSSVRVAVAHRGSKDSGRFMVQGWYVIGPNVCDIVGEFPTGNFYFFAEGSQKTWAGDHAVCTKRANFARWDHVGTKCPDRDLRGFASVSVEQDVFEVNLNE